MFFAASLWTLPAATLAQDPAFHRGPYLQLLQPRSVYVVWQSDVESTGRVEVDPNGPTARSIVSDIPARQHEVLVEGLTPDSSLDYRVVLSAQDGTTEVASTVSTFRTAPEDLSTDIRFAVLGDYGTGTQAQRDVRENIEAMDPLFVVTTGDNAYVSGSVADFDRLVFGVYHDLMRTAAFFPAIGNHDVASSGIVNFSDSFVLPANNPINRETFYSFDLGAAHFV